MSTKKGPKWLCNENDDSQRKLKKDIPASDRWHLVSLLFTQKLLLFKRGASKAAEGCLASEAAKLVKTAIENLFTISQTTCAWK